MFSATCCAAGILVCVCGCDPSAPSHGRTGNEFRIVSLAPSATEIIFALGAEDRLIGVTDCCDYPPEAKRIEQVGGYGNPSVEKLLALSPDVVIASGVERRDLAEAVRNAGIHMLDTPIRSIDELFDAFAQIGDAVGKSRQAKEAVARMRSELDAVAARVDAPLGQRPKVFVEIGDRPLMTAGGASFLNDLIARAGGVNVACDLAQAYPTINPEKVIEWDPDVIVVTEMGQPGNAATQLPLRIGWAGISAVKNGRVIDDICPDLLLRPGPRLIEGVKALAARLHPNPNASHR
jgi:iron complex transport system substrate-binding protein